MEHRFKAVAIGIVSKRGAIRSLILRTQPRSTVVNDHIIPFEMEIVYGSPSGQLAFLDVVEKALSR